jgi:hypothetical protein
MLTPLTLFGLFAVTAMLVCYALESRSAWFTLLFAFACWLGSLYGFLQGAWPFGLVEAIWGLVALKRWRDSLKARRAQLYNIVMNGLNPCIDELDEPVGVDDRSKSTHDVREEE